MASPAMAYLSEPLASRVFFGPFPTKQAEMRHLLDKCGVTHIVNMKPLDATPTKTGLPRDSWYRCFWEKGEETWLWGKLPAPELMRFPVPKKDMKRRDLVAWYAKSAQRVATEGGPEAIYYVHHENGLQEEALLAFTLCEVLSAGCVPDVDAWIAAHPDAQGVLLADEDRELLRECVTKLSQAGARPMDKWVKVNKRAKLANAE